ncbi:MAG: HXXEE domain-containing protein [Prevotella sp.]
MSPLSVLILVVPLPIAFIFHDAEEVILQHRWIVGHQSVLVRRFPGLRSVISHIASLGTKAFAIAALEELILILSVTCYVFAGGWYAREVWAALFMAFTLHVLIHFVQSIAVRGYVPGLVSSILLMPYLAYGMWSLWLVMSIWEMILCGIIGGVFMITNLRLAHWLGIKISRMIWRENR